jgi:hypothetical protein
MRALRPIALCAIGTSNGRIDGVPYHARNGSEGTHSELIFHIDGAGADLRISFKHIIVGDMDVIPTRRTRDRDLVVRFTCCWRCNYDAQVDLLKGSFVIVKRGCKVYETARMAAAHGAVVVHAQATQVSGCQGDRMLTIPVLAIEYGIADSLQDDASPCKGRARRGCLPARTATWCMPSGLGTSCCVAGDIVTSYLLLFEYDSWYVGAQRMFLALA